MLRRRRSGEEREAKAELEAKEKLSQQQHQQQRSTSGSKNKSPTSPRNATASSSSPRSPTVNGAAQKKVPNKLSTPTSGSTSSGPAPLPSAPMTPGSLQMPRQQQQVQRPTIATAAASQSLPPTPIVAQMPHPPHLPQSASHNQIFPHPPPQGIAQASPLTPRMPFPPGPNYGFPPPPPPPGQGPSMAAGPPSALAPSALPRSFGQHVASGPFDPSFIGRSVGTPAPAPIGPPSKQVLQGAHSHGSITSPLLPPGSARRASLGILDPGPVARPIAPIARPEPSGPGTTGSNSPRRSPSPKGVLGSSALIAEEDEVIAPPSRRGVGPITVGAVGQGWGPASPRAAVGENRPWGPPGFVGGGHPGRPATSVSVGNLWGGSSPNPNSPADWQPNAFYNNHGASFVNHSTPAQPH